MAIWNGNPQTGEILNLAALWKDNCLLNDGSLIDNEMLWTSENLNALYHAFFDNPLFGKRTFIEKLSDQVDQKGDMVQKLCSQVLLVLFLFPHKSAMGLNIRDNGGDCSLPGDGGRGRQSFVRH